MKKVTLQFSEMEHPGDISDVRADLIDSGAKLIGSWPMGEDEHAFEVEMDWDAVVKFEATDSVELCTNWSDIDINPE